MFYSDVILSKRGPLAKVWLAAHTERRLSKAQLVHTDVVESVESIIGGDGEPMALRLSGQLLLGVARIYARQAKYLLDDCNEALLRLKTAFRSGALDSTDMTFGTRQAITLPVTRAAYDLSLPDPAFEGWEAASSIGASEGRHSNRYTARPADITLQRFIDGQLVSSPSGWASGDFFDPNGAIGAASPGLPAVERRDSQGRAVDANGDVVEEADETFSSIGVGRDAQGHHAGRASLIGGDLTGFDDFGADDFLMPEFGGASATGGLDLGLEQFDAERQRSATPARGSLSMLNDLTPQTKRKMQLAVQKRSKVAKRAHRHLVDPHTELNDGSPSRRPRNADALLRRAEEFLPARRNELRLIELERDPTKGLLPFCTQEGTSRHVLAAAMRLAPELQELFAFDPAVFRRLRGDGSAEVADRAGAEDNDDEYGSEIGRRLDPGTQFDFSLGDNDIGAFDFDAMGANDDTLPQFDLETMQVDAIQQDKEVQALRRSTRIRDSDIPQIDEQDQRRQRVFHDLGDLGRLSTPSERASVPRSDLDLSPSASNPLRAFDAASGSSSSASEAGESARTAADIAATRASTSLGLSKNAIRAVQVLQQQLGPGPDAANAQAQRRTSRRAEAAPAQASTLSFQDVTRNASRRAAAGFFFELLALGTKDYIDVEQDESYGDIRVQAKTSFWQLQQAVRV